MARTIRWSRCALLALAALVICTTTAYAQQSPEEVAAFLADESPGHAAVLGENEQPR